MLGIFHLWTDKMVYVEYLVPQLNYLVSSSISHTTLMSPKHPRQAGLWHPSITCSAKKLP